VQARRKVLDQALSDSMNTVHEALLDIVRDVAHEHRANMVLIKQQVLWTDKALDGTDEILARLNAKMPTVTVKMAPEENDIETPK
jgi:outer membrane protein